MKLDALAARMPLVLLAACSTATASGPGGGGPLPVQVAAAPAPVMPAATAASAGDIAGTAAPDATAEEIARLRAEGPAALARLLATYDRLHGELPRQRLAATIDKVAGQRYATTSRLFWYTDLDAAKAVARATGKPILSLRMLGRLDEDLSCANSRFFRTTLYPDAAVGALLREHFVLHWSSERMVPRVTIDFGDGRKLESTVTGNSAHYLLDADGRPIDVLPGLYAPAMFVRQLELGRALHASLRGQDDATRARTLIAYHRDAAETMDAQWRELGRVAVSDGGRRPLAAVAADGALAAAQLATVAKSSVEVPMLKTVDVGADPGELPDDVALWAAIGERLLGAGEPSRPARRQAAAPAPRRVLAPQARGLVDALLAAPAPGVAPLDDAARAAVIARLEQTIVADTAINEARLRPLIRSYLIAQLEAGRPLDFASLNTWIYDVVFRTPRGDDWLGLLPRDTFTGLPGGAIVARAR